MPRGGKEPARDTDTRQSAQRDARHGAAAQARKPGQKRSGKNNGGRKRRG